MRSSLIVSLMFILVSATLAWADRLPNAMLFPVSPGDGAQPDVAAEATQAIKTYLRQTGKAEVADFDPESVLLRRAVEEHRIAQDELVGVSTPDARLRLGKLIGMDLVVSGDVTVKDDTVTVSVWLADVRTRKVWRLNATAGVGSGDRKRALSNAVQSAASSVIYQLADEALKKVEVDTPTIPETPAATAPPAATPPADKAETHVELAEKFISSGDDANAILEYRRAINADPKNIDIRLKLVQVYVRRKMYTQAVDEIERALKIDPENEALRGELARIYEERGAPEKAAEVYVSQADKRPKDLTARLAAGDYYWQQKMFDEAEEQYRLAVQVDPNRPQAHERLALLLAAQSYYVEGRKELEALQRLDPRVLAERYARFRGMVDRDIRKHLGQYDSGASGFASRTSTREQYYELVRGIGIRIDFIAQFLAVLTPPEASAAVHRRVTLGCSLISQACSQMLRYLETNKTADKEQADIFLTEARKHLGL